MCRLSCTGKLKGEYTWYSYVLADSKAQVLLKWPTAKPVHLAGKLWYLYYTVYDKVIFTAGIECMF